MERGEVGRRGEDLASEFLAGRGWEIVERNRVFETGELDIVARRAEHFGGRVTSAWAFVEVKTRASSTHFGSGTNITPVKRAKLVALAKLYMAQEGLRRVPVQIDVIEVDLSGERPRIAYYPRAVDADGALR